MSEDTTVYTVCATLSPRLHFVNAVVVMADKKLELPKFIVFDFISKSDEKYYYEGLGDAADLLPFLQGVANGTVYSQYEGNWGAPDRLWRKAKEVY